MFSRETYPHAGQTLFSAKRRHPLRKRSNRRRTRARLEQLERRDLLAVTFQFNFANDGNFGFNDPMKGADRKAAMQSTADELGSWFNHTATISVDVFNQNTGNIGAFAMAYFDESNPPNDGFYAGIPQQKTLGGADGNGAAADGAITVIWENAGPLSVVWELGDDVTNGEIDFQSLVIHELTHLMGFASDVQENGADLWDSGLGNPSIWQPFDQFLSDNAGSRFINPANQHRINVSAWQSAATGGTADNSGLFFNGANAVAANGGNPVPIYSPATWEEGSSVSHIRIIDPTYTDATHLMVPFIRDGQVARRWNPVEAAMMRDIGYNIVMPEPAILLTPSGGSTTVTEAGGTDTFDVQLTVRPPSDVKVTIAAADSSEVSVNNPTTLTFTPVNWNTPQTVTLTGVDDSDTDGDVVSTVTASIVVAQSDPMYASTAAGQLSVSTTDNDIPLNVVTTGVDENDANPSDGAGVSLREAIQWANSHPGGDIITIDASVSAMLLTLGQIEITETLSIVGNGAANTKIDANNTSRILKVTGGDLSLKDLKMEKGATTVGEIGEGGGAIQFLSGGSLLLDTVQFVSNSTAAPSSEGGAVYVGSGGSLMVANSSFQNNFTLGDNASGGAVYVAGGTFAIQGTIFLGNRTEGIDAGGGAVAADFSSGQIAGTLLQDNFTKGEVSAGGAIFADLTKIDILDSTIAYNRTEGQYSDGGGIYAFYGPVAITNSTISGNKTQGQFASGGGIALTNADQAMVLTHVTLSKNMTEGQDSTGGGLFFRGSPVNVRNSIIAENTSATGTADWAEDQFDDPPPVSEVHYSLIGDNSGTGLTASATADANGNLIGTNAAPFDPGLDDLQPNGGPVHAILGSIGPYLWAHAVQVDSPALNAGSDALAKSPGVDQIPGNSDDVALLTDQRGVGFPRNFGGHVDMGAVEYLDNQAPGPIITSTISGLTRAATIPIEIDFGEEVVGFDVGDLTITNGTASNFASHGNGVYTVDIAPAADGLVKVDIAANVAQDLFGNNNVVATTFSITSDRTAPASPVITGISDDNGSSNSDGITNDQTLLFSGTAEAGSTVALFRNGLSIAAGTVAADGKWLLSDPALLVAGSYVYTAAARDAVFNTSQPSAGFNVTIDLTAPAPTITSTANSPTAQSPIPVTIDFGESVADFVLGDIAVSNGSASNLQSLGNGQFTVDVTPTADGQVQVNIAAGVASDVAGNNNTAATTFSITSDRTAPAAPVITGFSTDTGISNSDGITNDQTLLFSGMAEAGSTVVLFRDGISIAVGIAAADGNWSLSDSQTVAAGSYVYTARSLDAVRNTSQLSAGFNVTIDLTAPAPTITSTATSPTALSSIPVTIDFGESVADFGLGDITVSNGTASNLQSLGNGQFTVDVTPAADGEVQVDIAAGVASDIAGNNNTAATTFSITSDRTAPAAPIITGISQDTGSSSSDGVTTDTSLTISGTAEAGSMVEVFRGATSIGTATATGGSWSLADGATLTAGDYVYTAKATDVAGNVGLVSDNFDVTVDLTSPAPVISSTVTGPTNLATIPVVVTFGESVTGFVLSDISVTNGTPSNFQSSGNGVFTLDVAPNSDGAVQINIAANVAQDLAGNGHSAAATFNITSDRTAPAAPVITGISGDAGSSDSDGITNSPLWAVLGTAEAGTVVELFLNGNSVGTVSHQGTWLKDQFDSKSDGTFVYTAQATDAVGNVSAMSESFTVVLDRAAPAAPSITGISDDTGSSGSDGVTNDTSLTISGTAEAGSTVEVFRGATSLGTTTATGGDWSLADSATLVQGNHVYSAKATDVAGNTSAASANFTATIDVTKPTPSITSSESSPSAASPIPVTINFGESVTGFVLADITVTNGVASNLQPTGAGTFTVEVTPSANGVVQVTVPASVATDLAGNANLASATFEIVSGAIAESDLSLSLIDLPTTVRAGVGLIYLLEVTNNGPDDATGTEVTVDLPPGVIYEPDFSSSDCTLDGNIVTCAIGDLPADPGSDAANTTRRTVTVHVPSGTAADARLGGLASVSSNNDDATAANNDAAVNTVATRESDLRVEVVADPVRPKAGDVINYKITVTNDGPSDAANVRVIHQLADGLEFDPAKSTSGSTVSDQTVTYNIGTMKVHDVKTFNIATKAAPQGDASSTTSVTSAQTDVFPDNNSAAVTVAVAGPTDTSFDVVDDNRATQQNTGLPIKLSSLLRNDIRTAAVTSFGQPAHGTVTYQSGADTFVYTPDPGFVGTDSFTYTGQNTLGDELILTLADADLNTVQLPVSNAKWQLNVSPSTLGSSGPVDMSGSDFQFTLEMNQATPAILSALTSGDVLPKVSLTQFRVVEGAAVELGRWTLHNARISSLTSTDLTDGLPPGEMYSIAYDKLEYDVTLPNDKTGNRETAGARVHVGFDDVKNTPFDSAQFGSASVGKFGKNSENLEKLAGTYLKIDNNLITEVANWDLAFTEGSIREKTQRLTFQLDSSADPVVAAYFMGRAISQETLADVVLRKQQQAEGNNLLKQQVALKNVVVRSVSTDVNLAGKNITSVTLEYDKVQVARSIVQKTGETGEKGRFVAWDFAETKVAENFDSGKFTGAAKPELRKEPDEGPETVLSTDFGDIEISSFSYVSGSEDSAATIDAIEFQASFDVMAPEILRRLLIDSVESKPMTLTRLLTNGDTRSQVLALELTGAKVTSFSLQLSADDSNGVYSFTVSAQKVMQTNTFSFDGQGAAPQVVTVDHLTGKVTPASTGFSSNAPRTSSLALSIGNAEVEIDRVQVAAAVIADEAKGISEITGDRITIFSNWNQFSASILTASLVGQVIPEVQLIQRTSGMSDLQFAKKLTLKNVVVEKYGTADSSGRPFDESFDLRFDSIKVDVSDPITGDGKLVEAFTGYDFKQKEVADDRKVVSPIRNDERIIGFLQSSSPALVTTGLATPISSFSFDGAAGTTDPFSVTVSLPFSQGALALLDRLYGSGVDSTLTLSNGARGKLNQTWELSNAFVTSVNFDVVPGEPSEASITLQYDGLKLTNHRFDNTGRKSGEQSVEIDPVRPSVIGSTSIPGNVSDPQFRSTTINFGSGEFEVLSSRWGASAAGTSGASINVDDSDFRFETRYSESLTGLVTALASGQTYANVTIARYQRSPDRSSFAALTWKLKNVQVSSVSVSTDFETPGHGLISFSLSPDVVRQELKWPNQTTGVPTDVDPFEFNFNERQMLADAAFETLEQLRQDTAVVTVQVNGVQDPDTDSVGNAIEDGAPNNGDGNNDGTADSQQNNVTSLPHPITGDYVTLAAPAGQNLTAVSISANPDESVTPPADIDFRVGVIEYELTNAPSTGESTITIFVDGTSGFNTYYKFGPTPSNPTPHYYRFLYDGRTGAEIFEDRIVVHLRDGERGDDDLTVNGVIVDPGAPAINLSLFPHQNSMLRSDVNDDGEVSPIDALLIINELNLNGAGPLPVPLAFPITANKLLDVNGDNEVSPIDVGIVITELNTRLGGEGERLFAGLTEANPFAAGNLTPSLVAAETTAAIESERGVDSSRASDGSLLAPLGSTNHVRESLFATFDSRRDAAASPAGRATGLSIESPNNAHFGQVFAARRGRLHRDLSRFESDVDSLFESWDGDAG